jgi:hypothetical protein
LIYFFVLFLCRPCAADEDEFVDNYDMNGDYAKHVVRVEGMRVWNQYENGFDVRGWGPRESGKEGTLVFHYGFDRPIESCSLKAYMKLWLETDRCSLAVSTDDQNYIEVNNTTMFPEQIKPYRLRVLDLTPIVQGKRDVYLRIRLTGKQLNTHITTPEFLRTTPNEPSLNAPHQFEFRAKLRP